MFKVVKPFAFSLDGFTRVDLDIGDVREDFGSHTDGLVAEGYVSVDVAKPDVTPTAVVSAPDPAPALFAPVQPVDGPVSPRRKRNSR